MDIYSQDHLGGLFMVGFQGLEFDENVRDLIDSLRPAGVILFKRNISSPLQVAKLNHNLQEYALERLGRGLFIGVDQEGGRVRRLVKPFTEFGPPRGMAESPDPGAAVRLFAETTARELRLVGFNLDFAPVMDVVAPNTPLDSTVIGDRSYGDDPVVVAELGGLVIMTLRSLGIIPCSKHFPGHGGTLVDSHVELPVDNRDYAVIETRDLYPFKKAIEGSVEMIMTAHALFPSIDTRAPATVSSRTLSGLLRKELGFKGVIVTDDLDMGAITRELSPEEAGLMAFKAGADLLLVCNEPSKAFIMRETLSKALDKGEIEPWRVHESLDRLERLRQIYGESMNPCDVAEAQRKFGS